MPHCMHRDSFSALLPCGQVLLCISIISLVERSPYEAGPVCTLLSSRLHLTSQLDTCITTTPCQCNSSQPAMPASSSIQSYFTSSPTKNSDGFTADEVQSALQSSNASAVNAWTVCHISASFELR